MPPEAAGPGCRRTARTAQDRRPGPPRRRRAATTSDSCRRAPRAGPAVRAVARRARLPRAPDPYRRRSGSMPPRPPRLFTLAPVDVTEDRRCRLGVLAFGDSITNGDGELRWGVALQSWALWVARALGLPFTSYAFDGARVADVVRRQIPAFERYDRGRDARYQLGCLYIGVNDVRAVDWDVKAFESDFGRALAFVSA